MHAYFEKSVLVIRYDLSGCWCKNIMNESLETSLRCCRSLCAFPNSQNFKVCGIGSHMWREGEEINFQHRIFCSCLGNHQQEFVKEVGVSKKEWGHRPLKATAKSWRSCRFGRKCYTVYLPTNLPPCMRLMKDVVPLRH